MEIVKRSGKEKGWENGRQREERLWIRRNDESGKR
jgi:hypothetical protein